VATRCGLGNRRRVVPEPDRDALVERYLPLARTVAARYRRGDESFEDIFQVACFGLVKAVDRFDAARGVAFSSFAVPTMTGEIKRHYRDRTWSVHVPRDLQELALRVERTVEELTGEHGRRPSVPTVARALGATEEEVLEALGAAGARRASSLDEPLAHDDEAGQTAGDACGVVEDGYEQAEQRATLDTLLRCLTAREREVVRLRFEEDLTQAEIGERIGLSQMQISRVLRQAVDRVRTVARGTPPTQGSEGPAVTQRA
jgi:RNA polymerase sigma-B factor